MSKTVFLAKYILCVISIQFNRNSFTASHLYYDGMEIYGGKVSSGILEM